MKMTAFLVFALFVAVSTPAQGQAGLTTRNPLDEIKDELKQALSEAGVPFTAEQEKSITLVLEESRRASEDLFGAVMDFSDGPPTSVTVENQQAGIQWMNDDFRKRVRQYLTSTQLAVWDKYLAGKAAFVEYQKGTAGTKEQIQQIRINNNPFSSENQYSGGNALGSFGYFRGGSAPRTEVIRRGGKDAFHGDMNFRFKDESLNARNPFASNKPPYQLRYINMDASGPVIRNRLTLSVAGNDSEEESADTIHAQTPEGLFQLGFTHPSVDRRLYVNGIYQLNENQSLSFGTNLGMYRSRNQGIGGLTLPERASTSRSKWNGFSVRHVWIMSSRTVHDLASDFSSYDDKQSPVTRGAAIDVLGAFSSGGAQDKSESRDRDFNLRNVLIYTGTRWAIRTGGSFRYWKSRQSSENNFLGSFTFSDLRSYLAGVPIIYSVTRGNPLLKLNQTQWSAFWQSDLRVSNQLSLLFGLRYEDQTNLDDHHNFDPRFGMAYALGNSTVVRAGVGMFHERLNESVAWDVHRLDGTRQYDIVVNNPSYPDPFQSGDVQFVPPSSRRVFARDLVAPYNARVSVAVEKSLPYNLFFTSSYDYQRGIHQLRSRNLNAPFPGQTDRPDPSQGYIWQLESTGLRYWSNFRVTMRQRFSIFSLNANYTRQWGKSDADGPFSTPSDNYNLRLDWGRLDQRGHQFEASVSSRLPFGLFLTTSTSVASGGTYNITKGKDDNGDGIANDRPPGVRRNSGNGPGFRNVSFNITKTFSLGKNNGQGAGSNLNVFANMNNAFNFTNLGTPNGVLTAKDKYGNSLFGRPFSALNPREIEVGMRFQF